jgi:hypothetical protein
MKAFAMLALIGAAALSVAGCNDKQDQQHDAWLQKIKAQQAQDIKNKQECGERAVPSRVVLEFGDAISGISRVSGQAARSIG